VVAVKTEVTNERQKKNEALQQTKGLQEIARNLAQQEDALLAKVEQSEVKVRGFFTLLEHWQKLILHSSIGRNC
jgi:hypothetical protein